MMSDMKRFESKLDAVSSEMMEGMKDELNRRDIGGGMYHAVQIQEEIQGLREEFSRMRSTISSCNGGDGGGGGGGGGSGDGISAGNSVRRVTQLYSYDGKFHILPQHYIIPSLTLASFIAFYLIGNPIDGIPPFRLVKPVDLKESNKNRKVNAKILTDMKKMMQFVERAGRESNVWEEDPNGWTPAGVTRLYETIHWKFRIQPAKGKRRFEGITWITYLGIVKRAKGVLVGDDAGAQEGTAL